MFSPLCILFLCAESLAAVPFAPGPPPRAAASAPTPCPPRPTPPPARERGRYLPQPILPIAASGYALLVSIIAGDDGIDAVEAPQQAPIYVSAPHLSCPRYTSERSLSAPGTAASHA
jgi:hypothetical protein